MPATRCILCHIAESLCGSTAIEQEDLFRTAFLARQMREKIIPDENPVFLDGPLSTLGCILAAQPAYYDETRALFIAARNMTDNPKLGASMRECLAMLDKTPLYVAHAGQFNRAMDQMKPEDRKLFPAFYPWPTAEVARHFTMQAGPLALSSARLLYGAYSQANRIKAAPAPSA